MLRIYLRVLLPFLLATIFFVVGAQEAQATVTYIVGSCKGGTFSSIQSALEATPAPNIVEVCPGTYNEQLTITKPVTLKSISGNGSDKAIIAVPTGGLPVNATNAEAESIAAQIFVSGTTDVNISNIVVDAMSNNPGSSILIVGIFYQNSSGTVDHITSLNQKGNGFGVGVYMEGGASNPSITVENSSIHDFDSVGILTGTLEMNAKINGNVIVIPNTNPDTNSPFGFLFSAGSMVTATGNYIEAGNNGTGFGLYGGAGTISGNTVVGGGIGAFIELDGAISFKSNKLLGNLAGVFFNTSTTLTEVQGNMITNTTFEGIEFSCNSINGKVHSNTIMDAPVGIDSILSGTTSANTYYDVGLTSITCP